MMLLYALYIIGVIATLILIAYLFHEHRKRDVLVRDLFYATVLTAVWPMTLMILVLKLICPISTRVVWRRK